MTQEPGALDRLNEYIGGLPQDEITGEIKPFVGSGHSALSRIISESTQLDPVIEVIGTVVDAIGKTDEADRSSLGADTLNSISWAFRDVHFESAESANALIEKAFEASDTIQEPYYKASQLLFLSNMVREAARANADQTMVVALMEGSFTVLERAAEAAGEIEHAGNQDHALSPIVKRATEFVDEVVVKPLQGAGQSDLPTRVLERTIELYEQERKITARIDSDIARPSLQSGTAIDMLKTAGKLGGIDPIAHARLFAMSMQDVDIVLSTDNLEAKIQEFDPLSTITMLGSDLAEFVHEASEMIDNSQRQQILQRISAAFEIANDRLQELSAPRFADFYEDMRRRITGSAERATKTAANIIGLDFPAAKRILEIGFKLALAEAPADPPASIVIDAIKDQADLLTSQQNFELHAMAHRLITRHSHPEESISEATEDLLKANATSWLEHIGDAEELETVTLQDSDLKFIRYSIQVADVYNITPENLARLGKLLGDHDPDAQGLAIEKEGEIQRTLDSWERMRKPGSETVRLALEFLGD